jgi:hypothetical protein
LSAAARRRRLKILRRAAAVRSDECMTLSEIRKVTRTPRNMALCREDADGRIYRPSNISLSEL